jgi:hypothetical protein
MEWAHQSQRFLAPIIEELKASRAASLRQIAGGLKARDHDGA